MNNNIVEYTAEDRGYIYHCVLYNDGHRCGYVGLPKGHKWYGVNYEEIPIWCHGGLTFSEMKFPYDIGRWYIGFDTAHLGDGHDFDAVRKHFKGDKEAMFFLDTYEKIYGDRGHVWTVEEIIAECKEIINQLEEE